MSVIVDNIISHIAGVIDITLEVPVFLSRFSGNPVRKIPVACVYFEDVSREIETIGRDRTVFNEATFVIEYHDGKGTKADIAENLDYVYFTLQPALDADRTMGGHAFHGYVSSYRKDVSEESDTPRGVGRIEMEITWYETQTDNGGN